MVVDLTAPACVLTGIGVDAQGRRTISVRVEDTDSGLSCVVVTTATSIYDPNLQASGWVDVSAIRPIDFTP